MSHSHSHDHDREPRTIRRRHQDLLDDSDNGMLPPASPANPTALVRTTTVTTYPTTALSTFAVQRVKPSGAETEGAAVTLAVYGGVFYAKNVGSTKPPASSDHLATLIDGLWQFRYDG